MQMLIRMVHTCSDLPMLHSHGGDGTPNSVVIRHTDACEEEKFTRRGFRHIEAYNCQSSYLCILPTGEAHFHKVFHDPKHMEGHDCQTIFAYERSLNLCPRQHGHKGMLISHVSYDGAVWAKMRRLHFGAITVMYHSHVPLDRDLMFPGCKLWFGRFR